MTNLSPAQVLRCLLHKDCWSAFGLPLGDSFDENHRPVYDALKSFHERWPEKAVASISALTAFVEKSDRDMLRVVKNATVPDEREVRLDAMRNYAMLNEFSKLAQENGDALAKGKVNIPEMISKLADVERRFAPKEKLIRASTFKFERVKNERTEGALSLPSSDLTIRFDGGPTPGELLTFIAATPDRYLRAFDSETGEELWKGELPAGGHATPMIYRRAGDGRQFVVIAAAGHFGFPEQAHSDQLVAFALPESRERDPR